MRRATITNTLRFFVFSLLCLFTTGCAGVIPVPGGGETINKSFYKTEDDLKQRILSLNEGMTKSQVFNSINRAEEDLIILSRDEIMFNLYGGQKLEFSQNHDNPLDEREFLKSLTGYKLIFKDIKRKHGLSSPISIRTNEVGFNYVAAFIFKDGILYEKPILSGGSVDASSSKTIFDYLNPSMVLNRI